MIEGSELLGVQSQAGVHGIDGIAVSRMAIACNIGMNQRFENVPLYMIS